MKVVTDIQEEEREDCSMKMRKPEDTSEVDEPETEKKEKKGTVDSSPMEKQRVKSAPNKHEEKSDDSSLKERKSRNTIETDKPESEPEKKKDVIDLLPVKEQTMRSTSNIQEEESDCSPMKEHEKKKIRENTDFEASSLRWKVIGRDSNEAKASDNNVRFINIQTKQTILWESPQQDKLT